MKDEKNYYTEIHTTGFKYTNKFSGFDSACAHFSTNAEVDSPEWINAKLDAIELIGGQQVTHGWMGYTVGVTFAQTGWEPVSVMSPAYEYRTATSSHDAVWKEIKETA